VLCANCSTENELGRKFCKECGTPLAVTCSNCGAANTPDSKFCGECGTLLGASGATAGVAVGAVPVGPGVRAAPTSQPPAALAAARVAERRLVSVLFADLVGFTTLSEGRDPEETRELLSRYFELARDVIERAGGTIEKFIGDAVMAVWGAPVARENDAELAVRAALELVDAVRTLGPSIQARAGVLTGEAAVTLGAVGQGMVAGDLVNTASRLQSAALPGTVLVGDATERAAGQAIVFEPAGPQSLKGKESPVPAFRALRVVAEAGGRNRAETLEAPFVGRDDELRLLKDLFTATARDRRPRLVSVMGPAGIGKSRLAWEFLKYLDGLVEDTYWHIGRSPSYGEGVTFWALGEMIRRRAGLLETDDDATTRAKLVETIAQWVSDEGERRWIETALLALLGLGEPLPGGRDELFAAWRTFFERIAERGTTVLTFEDLQWADTGTLDFIDHVLEWTRSLPLFVITLSRPELLERRPDWGAGRRNFVSLSLDPLPEAAMRELLAGLVPGLPDATVAAIVGRADGIPLYAVETVRMLVAEGRLEEQDGAYRPTGDLSTLAIPETLAALIAARLDGLEPAERSLLQDAAVLGQSFTQAGLAGISGRDPSAIEPLLRTLVRREVLTLNADPRSPERGQYAFVQALIREVAYNQLARADRKSRHLAAARWFESLGEDSLAGALAQQYIDAYRNAAQGAEADALAAQARVALRGAAERAASLGSHKQAVAFLRQALEITPDEAERAFLRERAGHEANAAAEFEDAQLLLEESISGYRDVGDRLGVARATTALSTALHGLSDPIKAIGPLERALTETADLESEPDVIRLITELARAYANGRDPRATATADRALALAEPRELTETIAQALLNRALALIYEGRAQEPLAINIGVAALAETHGLVDSQLRAINNASASLLWEDPRAGQRLVGDALDVARQRGSRGWLLQFLQFAAGYAMFSGEWDDADRFLAEMAAPDLPSAGKVSLASQSSALLAFRGDTDEAAARLAEVAELRLGDDPRNPGWKANDELFVDLMAGRLEKAYAGLIDLAAENLTEVAVFAGEWAARAALWIGDSAKARRASELYDAAPERGRFLEAMRLGMRAGVKALEGDRDRALAGYREAIRVFRDLDIEFEAALTSIEFAITLGPDEPEAVAAGDAARAYWTRLGSPPLLARLDEGLARWQKRGTTSPAASDVSSDTAAEPATVNP
jgi:class 3 adenylate cyclase/tetratricopeptide (TPR) repeat protein